MPRYAVPEGDTLHRAANHLRPLLVGQPVRVLDLVRGPGPTEGLTGREVTGVATRGRILLVHFEGEISLNVHLKMTGWIAGHPHSAGRRHGRDAVVVLDTERHCVIVDSALVVR